MDKLKTVSKRIRRLRREERKLQFCSKLNIVPAAAAASVVPRNGNIFTYILRKHFILFTIITLLFLSAFFGVAVYNPTAAAAAFLSASGLILSESIAYAGSLRGKTYSKHLIFNISVLAGCLIMPLFTDQFELSVCLLIALLLIYADGLIFLIRSKHIASAVVSAVFMIISAFLFVFAVNTGYSLFAYAFAGIIGMLTVNLTITEIAECIYDKKNAYAPRCKIFFFSDLIEMILFTFLAPALGFGYFGMITACIILMVFCLILKKANS